MDQNYTFCLHEYSILTLRQTVGFDDVLSRNSDAYIHTFIHNSINGINIYDYGISVCIFNVILIININYFFIVVIRIKFPVFKYRGKLV